MKVYLGSVGCRLNQSEIETIAKNFMRAGHKVVPSPGIADLTIINTCSVTHKAASDSRQMARHAAREGSASVLLTGCWATLEPEEASTLPNVDLVIPNDRKETLVQDNFYHPIINADPISRQLLTKLLGRTRAFIKVQDGCDSRCTFCLTTIARGKARSHPTARVIKDVEEAIDGGAQEIVLTGVQLGSWGSDFTEPLHISDLVSTLLKETDIPRLRLSSIEPWSIKKEFFSLWENPRVCRHLHLPLQSGSQVTLRRMARRTKLDEYAELLTTARKTIPGIAITTDVIVGFPGENEEVFTESAAFVKAMEFAHGHVFTFSARPGTAAATYKNQIHPKKIKAYSVEMRGILHSSAELFRQSFLGQSLPVLWESEIRSSNGHRQYKGFTDNYIKVRCEGPVNLWNTITETRLTHAGDGFMLGNIKEFHA
jgi:threonylcarbamoyladenosine tRNA methylthiotransferase MtaB